MNTNIIKTGSGSVPGTTTHDVSALLKAVKTKLFEQLCLLVLDGSGSMGRQLDENRTKAEATFDAVVELVQSLKRSSKSEGFHLAIITYSDNPVVRLFSQQVKHVNESRIELGEDFGEGPFTRIDLALEKADEIASAFLNSKSPTSRFDRTVRILLMSDGYCNKPESTRKISERIKANHGAVVRICSCLLSKNQENLFERAESLMKDVASEISGGRICYTNVIDGTDLRSFFERSSTEE